MNINDYLAYAIKQGYVAEWLWMTSMLGIRDNNFANEYIKIEDNKGYVKVGEEYIHYDGYKKGSSFIRIGDEITVTPATMKCLDKQITTIFGRWVDNYLLIEYPFRGKIPYIEGVKNLGTIIDVVRDAFSSEVITTAEYKSFVTSCTYLENLNKLVTPSSTAKLMVPPPGLSKYKTELRSEMVKKYGKDWGTDPTRVVEYDNKLKAYYEDFIKDDPSDGIIANKKNKGNALAKKYLTFSVTNAFGEQIHIDESLLDGYPDDPVKLSAMFNTTRSAGYSRGAETQNGGAVAKSVLRATSSVLIKDTDCKVTYGKRILVSKDNINGLTGRYIIVNKKITLLTKDNVDRHMGKVIEIRSPTYCKLAAPHYCKYCIGDTAGNHTNGVSLIVTNISSVLTTSSMKAMHNSQISSVKVDMAEIIK